MLPEVFANVNSAQFPSGKRETLGTIKVTNSSMNHNESCFLGNPLKTVARLMPLNSFIRFQETEMLSCNIIYLT